MASKTRVAQPSPNPTRKLSAAVVATAIVALGQVIGDLFWPGTLDDKFWVAMFPVAAYLAGYFVKDDANVVVVQEVVETEVQTR
jgi:hypothetical protein